MNLTIKEINKKKIKKLSTRSTISSFPIKILLIITSKLKLP